MHFEAHICNSEYPNKPSLMKSADSYSSQCSNRLIFTESRFYKKYPFGKNQQNGKCSEALTKGSQTCPHFTE